ncbi:MAG: sulfite exporter TauE/SafE family protein [Methylacidiphilales bacterium]|nr:sulfite exporter TauE/SafE family protein [Candidatus Methylacidiphilales bacterium]
MLDFWLITTLGFLGSFGHCVGMCGPLSVAFSLSQNKPNPNQQNWQQQLQFHLLLNIGRLLSYALVGAAIGAIGSVLLASGQMAGVGSELRRWMAIFTGLLLIWFGLRQINPELLPRVPFLHPLLQSNLHNNLNMGMVKLSLKSKWWTPALLGITWGLMPCGFLYAAQIKAAETGDLFKGALTMLAFGLGTLPMMLGVGVSTSFLSKDRRSQLFRLGGWVTLVIGAIALLRTGDTMVDYTGHAGLFCLILALIARPISDFYAAPLRYRRALGVGAYVLAIAHTFHMLEHSLQWNLQAFWFLPPQFQWGMATGAIALMLMTPAALTSFDSMQKYLGKYWRKIHLLGVPALIFTAIHAVVIGSHYLGALQTNWWHQFATILLGMVIVGVLLLRFRNPQYK